MEILCGCMSILAEHATERVFQQCGDAIKYKSNIIDIDTKMQRLEEIRVSVRDQVVAAKRNAELVLPEVESWLGEVEALEKEKGIVIGEDKVSKARCCYGWCLNPKACHYLGRKAKKLAIRAEELSKRAEGFKRVSFVPNRPEAGTSSRAHSLNELESRASIVRDVMKALKEDVRSPVVVFGMSGIGKTTMLRNISNSEEALSLFDEVILVEVSREKDYLFKLQEEIADPLGLKRLSDQKNFAERAKLLSQRLKPDNILVMLDDVWERIDFDEVGIPIHGNCRVLISTRFQHLYGEVAAERIFIINGLKQEEAWGLFKKAVGMDIESTSFKDTAKRIVKKCDGLPIAISMIGRTLRGKKKEIWKDALRRVNKSSPKNLLEDEAVKKLLPNIEFCYECLESEEAKSFFFLCCIYEEGSDIQVEDLVRHGLGLGLFEGIGSMVEGRDRVETLIDRLINRSLLLKSNRPGYVKMHDLVRKVSLLLSSSASLEKKDRLLRYSLDGDSEVLSSSESEIFLSCRDNLKNTSLGDSEVRSRENPILLSRKHYSKNSAKPTLMVVDCKRLSAIPQLFQRLITIETLCLEHCDLGDASIIGDLKTLGILSLRHSSMKELPQSFRNLSNLWLLDLTECSIDRNQIISSGVISSLKKLQELYMLVKGDMIGSELYYWPGKVDEQEEVVSELISWPSLTTLEVDLPEVSFTFLQRSDMFDKLERFKISIGCGGRWDMVPSHHNCLRLNVEGNLLFEGSGVAKLWKKAQTIEIGMNVLKPEEGCFDSFKFLRFECGYTLEDIFSNTRRDTFNETLSPILRSITLLYSRMMMRFCKSQLPMGFFHELRRVELWYCSSLSSLFPLSMVKGDHLDQLEEIDIRQCSDLKQIVVAEGEGKDKGNEMYKIPNLIRLKLVDLEDFIGICRANICFPLLIQIHLEKLPQLVALRHDNTAPSSSSATTQHLFDTEDESLLELRFITVISCHSISSMFSSSSMESLQNLEDMTVKDCSSLRTLFNFEDLNINGHNTSSTLSCLAKMILNELYNLEYIWKSPQKIHAFQSLRILRIEKCSELQHVFPCYIAEGLAQLEELVVTDSSRLPEIIYVDQSEDEEFQSFNPRKFVFRELKSLILKNLYSLEYFTRLSRVNIFFPLLREIQLERLPQLISLSPSDTTPSSSSAETQHLFHVKDESLLELRTMTMYDCDSVSCMFLSNFKWGLQKLDDLTVVYCKSLRTLFNYEDVNIKAEDNVPSALSCITKLMLDSLPQLRYIWKSNKKIQAFRSLRILKIEFCDALQNVFPCYIGEGLTQLEELFFSHCKGMQEIIYADQAIGDQEFDTMTAKKIFYTKLKSLELNDLSSLEYFIRLRRVSIFFPLLTNIQLKNLPKLISLYANDIASSSSNTTIHPLFNATDESLVELKTMKVHSCNSITTMFSLNAEQSLQNLKQITVEDCQSLRTIFNFEDVKIKVKNDVSSALSCIRLTMMLSGLPKLKYIWKSNHKVEAFQSLRVVKINSCEELQNVFPCCIAQGLTKLEGLLVSGCNDLREIVYVDQEFDVKRIVFSEVKSLELKNLPSLVRFCGPSCVVEWPSLKKLELENLKSVKTCFTNDVSEVQPYLFNAYQGCEELEKLVISQCESVEDIFKYRAKIAPSIRVNSGFGNLGTLRISRCGGLTTLLPLSAAKSLESLEELTVKSCPQLQEIISKPADEEEENLTNILPNLTALELTNLPKLTCFTQAKYKLDWEFLDDFRLWDCPEMGIFCSGSVQTNLLSRVEWSFYKFKNLIDNDLNITIQSIYTERKEKGGQSQQTQ